MLEMDQGDAEEMEPAPTNRAYINHGPQTMCATRSPSG